ncbi:MAG: hypothetical protein PVF43_13880 [Candidatus Eiseniibacteriota bacterium]|jgi:hypothetical protein
MLTCPRLDRRSGRRLPWVAGCLLTALIGTAPAGRAGATSAHIAAPDPLEEIVTFSGTARDRDDAIVYRERHRLIYRNGALRQAETHYLEPASGEVFAELASDYGPSRWVPAYEFRDHRTGRVEGVRWQGGRPIVYRREATGQRLEERELAPSEQLVGGQGFNNLILDRLPELRAGETVTFRFVIPDRLDAVDLRLRRVSGEQFVAASIGGGGGERGDDQARHDRGWKATDVLTLRCEIDHWLLRLIAPSLRVAYETTDGRLLAYEGNSNLTSDDGDAMHVRIVYDHDG